MKKIATIGHVLSSPDFWGGMSLFAAWRAIEEERERLASGTPATDGAAVLGDWAAVGGDFARAQEKAR